METLIIIIILLILSAFFSASETSFTSCNRIRLKKMTEDGSKSAKIALNVLDKYDKCLTTILVGNNIVNIATSSIATIFCIASFGEDSGAAIATIATTVIVLIFGEILPKSIAKNHAESFCLAIGRIMWVLMIILTPVSLLFLLMQKGANKLFKKKGDDVSVTEQELIHIIDEIEDEGVLEEQESLLVRNALEFDETSVEAIQTPRVNVIAIDIHEDIQKVKELFFREEYTRLPVYEKSIDHIVGFISYKDFARKVMDGEDFVLRDIVMDTMFVPSLMRISEVLKKMQREKIHLAVVVDQYGGTAGIVTLEDILEELVGEIWDEDDVITSPVTFKDENTFELSGELSKVDFNRYFEKRNMPFEINGDFNTVGGWVFELFGKIPEVGDVAVTDRFEISVISLNNLRIGTLRFKILKPEAEEEK